MPPPDPFTGPAAARPNPAVTRLRRELTVQRDTFVGRQALPLLDALELYCAEQDRRLYAIELAVLPMLNEQAQAFQARLRDLERQVADQADLIVKQTERINGLMPPGEFITEAEAARLMAAEIKEDLKEARGEAWDCECGKPDCPYCGAA